MADLSALSTEELMKMRDAPRVDLSKVSTEELMKMKASDTPTRSMPDKIARQLGLTARAGIQGITAIPNMVGDAFGLDSSGAVRRGLTKIGLPEPEGAIERVSQDVAGALAGQGGIMKVGQMMTGAVAPVAQRVGDVLTSRPVSQLVGATGASGASGATREAGGGPVAQTVAGLTGGILAPVAADVAVQGTKALARGVRATLKPMTQSGREEVVGETLKRLATAPDDTVASLAQAGEIVPGSAPTTAQASRDPGLLTAERALRSGQAGGQFAERSAQQNQARNVLLNGMAKDKTALDAAKGERLGKASPLYEKAFSEVVEAPGELLALSKRPAFAEAVKRAEAIAAEEGINLGEPLNTMRGLHYIKMGMDDIIENAARDSSMGRTQRRAVIDTQKELLKSMDVLSPTYRAAREEFTKLSKPVNQMEALQDVRGRVQNAGTDPRTGEHFLSQAKFFNVVTKNEGELTKVLTKDQMNGLRSIAQDLDRGALSETAGRAAGSNTYQNISTAYVLGQSLGGKTPDSPMLQNLMRPLAWMNKLNEPALQELLTDAMLNPATARSLMAKPTPRAIESISLELSERARALGLGAAAAQANQGTQRERQDRAITR